jgi:hypothetical protein
MPSGRRWSSGSRSASTRGGSGPPRRVFQRLLPERLISGRCVEAYYLQRTRFESIAQRKVRRRQLAEDGNCGDQRAGFGGEITIAPYFSVWLALTWRRDNRSKANAHPRHPLRDEHFDLAGFVVMGLSLTLHRMAAAGRPLSVGLMCAGTALVFLGYTQAACCQISEISGSAAAHGAGDGSQLVLSSAAVSHPNVLRRHPQHPRERLPRIGPVPRQWTSSSGRAVSKEPLNSNYISIWLWGGLRGPMLGGLF